MKYYISRPNAFNRNRAQVSVVGDKRENHVDKWEYGDPVEYQVARTGYVAVRGGREVPNFHTAMPQWAWVTPKGGNPDGSDDEYKQVGGTYVDKNFGKSTELFTHHSPEVEEAFVDPSLRHAVPTMIGMAMKALGAEHDIPTASNDLSEWSSRLSQKAAARGLAKGHKDNPSMGVTNKIDMSAQLVHMFKTRTGEYENPYPGNDEATPEEVSSARSWARSRVKGKRGEQFKAVEDPSISTSQREWQSQRINPGPGQETLF